MAVQPEKGTAKVGPSASVELDDVERLGHGQIPSAKSDGGERVLKTTKGGILLVPQPSDDPDEPLNWSFRKKHAALIILAFMTFFVKFTATILAPGAHQLAMQFHTTPTRGTYVGSSASIVPSIAPFFWVPLSYRFGRRPVLLFGNLIAATFAIAVGRAGTYSQAVSCRVIMAFGASVGICIGPAAISDIFFLHEKGKRMGFNTLLLICSPYVGGVVGGSIQYNPALGWRWSMYISSMLFGGLFILQWFFVPETLYDRSAAPLERSKSNLGRRLGFRTPSRKNNWFHSFSRPFVMFSYPAVVLPSFWFAVCGMTEVANTAGFPLNFGPGSRWNFNTKQIGFCSFSGLIGALLGEVFAGPLCDLVAQRNLKKGKEWKPEKLLKVLISGVVANSAGILLYGLELNYPTGWAAALAGIAIFTFGQEILVTVLLTYMTDCYPDQAADVAIVFQFWLNIIAYPQSFYVPQWIAQPGGAKVPYIVFAALPIVLFPPCVGMLMWKGPQIRRKGRLFW